MQVPACLRRFSEEEINREVDLGRIVLTSEGYFYPRIFGGSTISATNKIAEKASGPGTSFTTAGTLTPSADRLYMASVSSRVSSGTALAPTVSGGGGLTWVQVKSQAVAGNATKLLTVFRAMKPSGLTSGTVTFSFGSQSQSFIAVSIDEFDSVDTSGTDGSGAIVQSNQNGATTGTTATVTLAAFADATNNAAFMATFSTVNNVVTPESPYTELSDQAITSGLALEVEWNIGQDTSVTSTWASSNNWVAIACEIAALGGTPISGTDANGTTTETATETAAIPGTDANGTTTEAATEIASISPAADTGTASSEVIANRAAVLTDSGTGTEDAAIRISVSDSGSGTETFDRAFVLPDSGTSSEAASLATSIPGTDSGTGTDAISSRALVAPDSGTDSEAISDRKVTLTDTGTDSEAATLTVAISSTDSGAGTEIGTAAVPISGTDSGSGTEDQTLAAALTAADTGTDVESLADRQIVSTDAGTSVEVATPLAAISDVDTGTDSETEEKTVAIHDTDSGTATTEDAAITAASISDSDSGTADETAVAGRRLISLDGGTAAEVVELAAAISRIDFAHSTESADQIAALATSDNGTDSEIAIPVSAVLSTADAGGFQDAGALHVYFPDTECGYGHDAGVLRAAYLSADLVTDSENGILHAVYSDTDSGTDSEFIEKAITDPDAGSISEVSALAAQISVSETGEGTDLVPTWQISQEDSGSSSDAETAKARYADQDYGTFEEFIADRRFIVFDISTGIETWGETRDIPPGDLNVLIGVGRGQPELVALKEITPQLVGIKTNGKPELISSANGTRLIATAKQGPELERVG